MGSWKFLIYDLNHYWLYFCKYVVNLLQNTAWEDYNRWLSFIRCWVVLSGIYQHWALCTCICCCPIRQDSWLGWYDRIEKWEWKQPCCPSIWKNVFARTSWYCGNGICRWASRSKLRVDYSFLWCPTLRVHFPFQDIINVPNSRKETSFVLNHWLWWN